MERNSPLPNDVAGTTFSQEEGRGYGEGSVMVDRKTNKRYARRDYGPICGEDSYEMKALVPAFSKKLKKKKNRTIFYVQEEYFNSIRLKENSRGIFDESLNEKDYIFFDEMKVQISSRPVS